MPAFEALPDSSAGRPGPTSSGPASAVRKLRGLAHLMRAVSAAYVVWVLWGILSWWLDAERVTQNLGHFLNRDLSGAAASQRFAALGLDLIAWFLLLLAVISLCAWLAIACQTLTQLSRPVQSFLLTAHLPAAEHIWKWSFHATDLLTIMFCLSLLMFAYVFTWTMEVAEENRSFV